jgi:hypothetical protein
MTLRNFQALFALAQSPGSAPATTRAPSARSSRATSSMASSRARIMSVDPHEAARRSSVNYRSVGELPTTL